MVYDEGFELVANNVKFFAFSKYSPSQNGNNDVLSWGFESYCGETLVGWYHNLITHERGCYKAIKLNHKKQATE